MFHPGKVGEIFSNSDKSVESADSNIQAMLEMWDDNVITVSVEPALNSSIKKGDVVLVDYSSPKLMVKKILRGTLAKQTWSRYREQFDKRKSTIPRPQQRQQSYVG